MKFTVKKSLIGIAALSLLAPVASHADTTTGPTIKDGFNNRTKDGRGSRCVATGGASQALGADCMSEADAMNAKAEAEAAARKAAKAESDAAAKAAAEAARDEALLANPPGASLAPGEKGSYVGHGTKGVIRDGYGRSCVKDGLWHPTMASEECDPELYGLYRSKQTQTAQSELAPRQAAVPPEAVQPQSELAPRLPYTAQEAVRPIYFAPFVAPLVAEDEDEAVAVDSEALAEDEEVTPAMMMSDADRALPADDEEIGMLAAIAAVAAAEDDEEEEAAAQDQFMEDEETTPDMMMSDADRALSEDGELGLLAAAGVAVEVDDDDADDDDDGVPGDDGDDQDTTPDMMMSEEDRTLPEDEVLLLAMVPMDDDDDDDEDAGNIDDDLEDEETTPDMMLSDADRTLAGEEVTLLAMVPTDDDDDDDEDAGNIDDDLEDEETTPDMMLSDADRTLAGEEVALLAMVPTYDDHDDDEDAGNIDDDLEDEETTPDMMLSDADRTLPGDDVTLPAAVAADDDDDNDDAAERAGDEDDADETTPDMMMSDADRILAGDDEISPGVAVLTDTSPGVAPAPEKTVESKPVIDNKVPDFPVTKHELAQAQTQAPAQAPKPAQAVGSLPVTINVQDGLFDFDRADLKSDFIAKLDSVADMLRESKVDAVYIVGHADPIGSAEYNHALSLRRAESAKRYLVGKGIDAKRISTSGVGEKELVVSRVDCAGQRKEALIDCLQPNRRVVVDVAGAMAAK